ncbi:MAG: carboxypeptidase regulatory-like domain-containing protein [Bryobacteraceae bacterium]
MFRRIALLAGVLLTSLSPDAAAQTLYGSLVGNITDSTGGSVPAAKIQAANTATGFTREAATNERGAYLFSDLQPGTYEVRIAAPSFAAFTQTGVAVSANTVVRVDVQLQLASVSETVTIAASAAMLQTDRSEVRAEITSRQIRDLPIPGGRNYQNLFKLIPGFTPPRPQNSLPANPQENLVVNVNGTTKSTNNTRIDGASNTHVWLPHHSAYVPPVEAIEAVNVVTNSMDAEQGLAGGAAISVTIKSGSNEFHGSALEYHTNSRLKAKNVFFTEAQIPKRILNQFGGSLGGPIIKNKLFFFGSHERTRRRQNFSRFVTIPTAPQRTGDFSSFGTAIYDPLTGNPNGAGRTVFPNAIVPASRHSRVATQIIELIPVPTNSALTGNYFASAPQIFDRDTTDVKVNWSKPEKLSMFGRYSFLDFTTTSAQTLGPAGGSPIEPGGQPGNAFGGIDSLTIAATYVFSPTFLIDANFGFARQTQNLSGFDYGKNIGLDVLRVPGTNGTDIFQSGMPGFGVPGYESYGLSGSSNPAFWDDRQFQYNANASWHKGAHNLRFGLDISRQHMNHRQAEFSGSLGPRGGFEFGGGPTALSGGPSPNQFNSFAAFILGAPTRIGKSLQTVLPLTTRNWGQGYYFRDQWQATRDLTVTLGARYELYPIPTRVDRGLERYDPNTNKMLIGGVGSVPRNLGVKISHKLVSPRVGLAYRAGRGWVARAGFGINTDPYPLARPLRTNHPIVIDFSAVGANSFQFAGRLEDGIPPIQVPALGSGIIDIPGTVGAITLDDKFNRGYVESFNVMVQRELRGGFVGQAGYVGTRGIRQMGFQHINYAEPGRGNAGRVLNQRFPGRTADTTIVRPFGTANYNALQAQLDRRFAGGYQFQMAYTWSKAIAFADEADSTLQFNAPQVVARNRALTTYDRTHNWQTAFVAELPFGRGKRWAQQGWQMHMLGGWQFNGIFGGYSGTPFTVTASGTSLNAPNNAQTADQVKPEVKILGGAGPGQSYFDPLAFRPVTEVRFGSSGLNILRGPGVVNLDLGLFREFRVTERVRIQFRGEAFNASNTPHFNNPGTNVSNLLLGADGSAAQLRGFSEITSAQNDERQFRLGLRISF